MFSLSDLQFNKKKLGNMMLKPKNWIPPVAQMVQRFLEEARPGLYLDVGVASRQQVAKDGFQQVAHSTCVLDFASGNLFTICSFVCLFIYLFTTCVLSDYMCWALGLYPRRKQRHSLRGTFILVEEDTKQQQNDPDDYLWVKPSVGCRACQGCRGQEDVTMPLGVVRKGTERAGPVI